VSSARTYSPQRLVVESIFLVPKFEKCEIHL